ncbi:hydroxyacylglutathione hydrolase [Alteromonas facilis]|uniref:hydroxyacylglutathione hydrolase n=1 Tax=Alteromonas facilis TaxID=2048004 RepID=UPI000C28EA39|nr:hydroxyacylglutathione hydrolase [Alteromonas facilis]
MHPQLPEGVAITPIPAYTDNYIWAFFNTDYCVVVDPGDAQPVEAFCDEHSIELVAVLVTHHHADHTGGLAKLLQRWPSLRIIGPKNPNIKLLNEHVNEGCTVNIEQLQLQFTVLDLPGHTLDHIGFVGHGGVLCGDTLFSAGCGRLFEGTPTQMQHSLAKLSALPDTTKVWCTHEYTLANMTFAQQVEPQNQALQDRFAWAKQQREKQVPTLPSNIAVEKAINPFLRSHCSSVKASAEQHTGTELKDELAVFTAVRGWKDIS